MKTSLSPAVIDRVAASLRAAHQDFVALYPGERSERQPVQTLYGGAHLFRANTAPKMGELALRALQEHAPDPMTLAQVLRFDPAFAERVYARVAHKLQTEPVEDLRIDFEDGYGVRTDAEEDRHAVEAAQQVSLAAVSGSLPPFCGIRLRPLTDELYPRAVRTLDLFVTAMLDAGGGRVPSRFVVTLPKVQAPAEVAALADLVDAIESTRGLPAGSVGIEIMIEEARAILDADGRVTVGSLVRAARGRCRAVHFGTYDYTASCGIAAAHQAMDHPACDFAKHCMQVALAGTGVWLSDGATNVLPVGARETVHAAWRLQALHVRRSLAGGFYQGWDLHPVQLVARYASVYAFYLEALESATTRLAAFIARAAQANRVGSVFDDAATGQGLLQFFLRGVGSGAVTEGEVEAAGLTAGELRSRSFAAIVAGRAARQAPSS